MHPSTASILASHSNYSPCNVLMNLQVCICRGRVCGCQGTYCTGCVDVRVCVWMCNSSFHVWDFATVSVGRLKASQGCVSISLACIFLTIYNICIWCKEIISLALGSVKDTHHSNAQWFCWYLSPWFHLPAGCGVNGSSTHFLFPLMCW